LESNLVKVDLNKDHEEYMTRAKLQEIEKEKDHKIPPDSHGGFGKGVSVYRTEDGVDYDAYMIKVDLKNGLYAEYVFYKLQILYDSVRDLY